MTECNTDSMPRGCAEQFSRLAAGLSKLDEIAADVSTIKTTVIGNGHVEGSLAYRVQTIEAALSRGTSIQKRWCDRLWKLGTAIALVVFGWLLRG